MKSEDVSFRPSAPPPQVGFRGQARVRKVVYCLSRHVTDGIHFIYCLLDPCPKRKVYIYPILFVRNVAGGPWAATIPFEVCGDSWAVDRRTFDFPPASLSSVAAELQLGTRDTTRHGGKKGPYTTD